MKELSNKELMEIATMVVKNKVNIINISQSALNWINGELLGDGCLMTGKSLKSAKFKYTSKHLEYINYVDNQLSSFGIERVGKIYKRPDRESGYSYQSRYYMELLNIKNRWYPKSKKIVPRDIKLMPITCRQWYIGDGCLQHCNRHNAINLATCAFPIYDVEWLCVQLSELGFLAKRQPSNNTIRIAACSIIDFLNYIGSCPVKCYQYKWNYIK